MKPLSAIIAASLILLTACRNNENDFDATGTFETTEVTVAAMSSGQLSRFDINEGQEIEGGDIVGQIDDEQLRLKKEQLETTKGQLAANRRQLEATRNATSAKQLDLERQIASIKQQIANAQRERQRYTELVNDGAVARKQLDEINYQISVLEKQLAATIEQLNSNNASLKAQAEGYDAQVKGIDEQINGITIQQAQLDDLIADAVITSPIAGTVLEKYVEQGEFVNTGKPLFKVADTRQMTLRAYVTSSQLEKIKVGQNVKVTTDYGDNKGKTYDGVISWISSKSEFTPKNIVTEDERADLVYAVKVRVTNDGSIKTGMYGKLKL